MIRSPFFGVVANLLLVASAGHQLVTSSSDCGTPKISPRENHEPDRMLGGEEAILNRWPSQVSLQLATAKPYGHFCGGTLTNNLWLLTATHCVVGKFVPRLKMARFKIIRGIPYPNVLMFKRENVEGTMDYHPRDGDIILASYPKTGTTWLNYIVIQILTGGQSFPSLIDTVYKETPQMEAVGPEAIDNLTGVRKYKHHYRYDMVKKNPKSKVIYIYRNPADTIVSFYHFSKEVYNLKIDLDEYFDCFLSGNVEFGGYFEHVLSFLSHKNDDNILLLSYEELLANSKKGILRIAKFLGEEYHQNLSQNETLLNQILEQTSFNYMKKSLPLEVAIKSSKKNRFESSKKVINFFRKGVVGDGKKSLSSNQMRRLREVATEIMKDSKVIRDWFKK